MRRILEEDSRPNSQSPTGVRGIQEKNNVSFVSGGYGDEQMNIFTDIQAIKKRQPLTKSSMVNKLIAMAEDEDKKEKPHKWGSGGRYTLFDK